MEETIVDRTAVKKGWDRTRRGRTEGDRKESMRDEGRKGAGTRARMRAKQNDTSLPRNSNNK